jgi:putative transposase
MVRLLPISDRAKNAEILALRHQLAVLQRHLHGQTIRFACADRAFLAALLHPLPRPVLHRVRLVRPETVWGSRIPSPSLTWPDLVPASDRPA